MMMGLRHHDHVGIRHDRCLGDYNSQTILLPLRAGEIASSRPADNVASSRRTVPLRLFYVHLRGFFTEFGADA